MIYTFRLLLVAFSLLLSSMLFAQLSEVDASPITLDYVEEVNVSASPVQGSFVVKNNYPDRSLSGHLLLWELSKNGTLVTSGAYRLAGVNAGDTKYVDLDKLFDIDMIESLQPNLISLYAEVQDTTSNAQLKRIVGKSVVLAEAAPLNNGKGAGPQRYQMIKVGGAKIHRIANGNSLSLDAYNQLSSLDLGKGNVLAGPITPTLSYPSLAAKQEVAHLIDSLGPTSVSIKKDELSGIIAYDLGSFGLLNLVFDLNDQGLLVRLQLENAVSLPTSMGLKVPLRGIKDSIAFVGQHIQSADQPRWGERRLGKYSMGTAVADAGTDSVNDTRKIALDRADIKGTAFSFHLHTEVSDNFDKLASKKHSMTPDAKFLTVQRRIAQSYGSRMEKPLDSGVWLFAPASPEN